MSIINHWPARFRALYGGTWPTTYVTMDLETTGFDFKRDVITEIAHCLVEDGRITDELSLVLDWTRHGLVPDHWLRSRLAALRDGMAAAGRACPHSYARMAAEGMNPERALAHYRDLFAVFAAKGILFAAHNGYGFDEKMLHANFVGFGIDPAGFSFGDNGLLDTDGIEKATQIPSNGRVQPRPDDTLRSYFHRVKYTRVSGVYSNLEDHCFTKYNFAQHGVTAATLHGALVDSRCVHYLMEAHRAQIDAAAPIPAPEETPPWIAATSATPGSARSRPSPRTGPSPPPRVRRRGQRNN